MDLQILTDDLKDAKFRLTEYTSLIWTERYSSYGDFTLVFPADVNITYEFKNGKYLIFDDSDSIMRIETIKTKNTDSGERLTTVSGRSLESYFLDRWVLSAYTYGFFTGNYTAHTAITKLIDYAFIHPIYSWDLVSNIHLDPDNGTGVLAKPISPAWPTADLYSTIKGLADEANQGFSLKLTYGFQAGSWLWFKSYKGLDRSIYQIDRTAVKLSLINDDLQDSEEIRSDQNYKNVAMVFYADNASIVTASPITNDSSDILGLDRRVLVIEAKNISGAEVGASVAKTQAEWLGRAELRKLQKTIVFEARVEQNSNIKYGVDYFMGDIVTLEDALGNSTSSSRVTEFVRSIDYNGYEEYPTFTSNST